MIAAVAAIAYFAPQLAPSLLAALGTQTATALAVAATTVAITTAATLALTYGLQLLAGRPTTAAGTPGVFRQAVSNSFILYGLRRAGGLLIFFHPVGKTYRYFVIAVAGHRCQGVVRWLLNDEVVTVNAGTGEVTSGKYAGNAWLWFARGTDDQVANPAFVAETGGKWTANHRGRGTALIYAKFAMKSDVVEAGMPNITAEIEGKDDVYDPRTDTRGYTRNAALVFYDWLAMKREEGGFGAYADEIDWDWVSAQANVCDEDVALAAGGTEKRYEFDSYITTGAAPSDIRDSFLTSCAGSFTYSGGKMLMRPGYYVPPSATLHEADLAGPITVPALLGDDAIVTEVAGTFVNPADLYQAGDIPTRSIPSDDVRQQNYDLAHVTSNTRAQRILEIMLRKAQAERRVTWPMNIVGIGISTLQTVQLATARYGLSNYAFQVATWGLAADFSVALSLEETNADIFDWDTSMELAPGTAATTAPVDTSIDTPDAANWTLVGATLSSPTGSIPALVIEGGIGDDTADDVIFEYRVDGAAGWTGGTTEPPNVIRKEITSVTPATGYEVAISYRVGGVLGARLILGPVTSGALSVSSGEPLVSNLSADGDVGAAAVTWRNPDVAFDHLDLLRGTTSAFGSATVIAPGIIGGLGQVMTFNNTGLSPGTYFYWLQAFDGLGNAYTAIGPDSALVS